MLLVGLTGNYGAGKSTVGRMFSELGAHLLDTDRIVAALLKRPAVVDAVEELLGSRVVDGDRRLRKDLIADIVFNDPAERRRLEGLLHPRVFEEVEREARGISGVVVVEVPLLFEGGYQGRFDRTIAVISDPETAERRLGEKGIAEEEVRRRLASQLPAEKKKELADYVIHNDGQPEETRRQAESIYRELLEIEK